MSLIDADKCRKNVVKIVVAMYPKYFLFLAGRPGTSLGIPVFSFKLVCLAVVMVL